MPLNKEIKPNVQICNIGQKKNSEKTEPFFIIAKNFIETSVAWHT